MLHALALSELTNEIIVAVVSTVLLPFLVDYLRSAAKRWHAEAEKAGLEKKQILMDQIRAYLLDAAANIAEKRFPILATKVVQGKVTNSTEVRSELYAWGDELRYQTQTFFKNQGIDLTKEVGKEVLDHLIETAANKVSPFPGTSTSNAIMDKEAAQDIIDNGIGGNVTELIADPAKAEDTYQFQLVDGELVNPAQ